MFVCCCACVDVQDGMTALHWASRNGHVETVSLLLDKGADIHAVNKVCVCAVAPWLDEWVACVVAWCGHLRALLNGGSMFVCCCAGVDVQNG